MLSLLILAVVVVGVLIFLLRRYMSGWPSEGESPGLSTGNTPASFRAQPISSQLDARS